MAVQYDVDSSANQNNLHRKSPHIQLRNPQVLKLLHNWINNTITVTRKTDMQRLIRQAS